MIIIEKIRDIFGVPVQQQVVPWVHVLPAFFVMQKLAYLSFSDRALKLLLERPPLILTTHDANKITPRVIRLGIIKLFIVGQGARNINISEPT